MFFEILRLIKHGRGTPIFSETGEDGLLWKVFRGERGHYLDVGAQHPYLGSNTYSFYKAGWRGIAIEPQKNFNFLWRMIRHRDVLINRVVSKSNESVSFAKFTNSLISTGNEEIMAKHIRRGLNPTYSQIETCQISKLYLKSINYLDPFFISIDVEGMELEVLQTIDFRKHQPRAILLEHWTPPWLGLSPAAKFLADTNIYELYAYTGLTSMYIHKSYLQKLRGLTDFLAD